tara:strand:+ start:276 stop:449 length:174 start_codon:yes stop_codon:yes gene_type:complete
MIERKNIKRKVKIKIIKPPQLLLNQDISLVLNLHKSDIKPPHMHQFYWLFLSQEKKE